MAYSYPFCNLIIMTKTITKLKEILGDDYETKIELAAKNGDIYDVLQ